MENNNKSEFTSIRVHRKTLVKIRTREQSKAQTNNDIINNSFEKLETLEEWREITRRNELE